MLHEVEPFNLTYRPYNKDTREYHGEFARLIDAVQYVDEKFEGVRWQPSVSHTLKREPDYCHKIFTGRLVRDETRGGWHRQVFEKEYHPSTPWVILTEFGVVAKEEVEKARKDARNYSNRGWLDRTERWEKICSRMVKAKGSADKVKTSCGTIKDCDWYAGYSNPVRGYYRAVRTRNEMRQNCGHSDEYGPGIVRGKRGRRHLPTAWDDRPVALAKSEGSWKHHSKRRKQWKPK